MTKKITSIILVLCVAMSLSACMAVEQNDDVPENEVSNTIVFQNNNDVDVDVYNENIVDNNNANYVDNNNNAVDNNSATTQRQAQSQVNSQQTTQTTTVVITQTAHNHSYLSATCTQPKKCSCGVTAGTALGHNYSSATCTSPQICSRCGASNGNALGHSYSNATCTSAKTCSRCGNTSGSALGHNYVNNKCSRCSKTDPSTLPVGLNELFVIDSKHYEYKSGTFTDSFGNTYDGVHFFNDLYESNNGREPHATYNLNGQYSKFTGSIVASTATSTNKTYYIHIYVDNVLVHSTAGYTKTTGKIDFNINVKGGQQLSICAGHENIGGDYNEEIGIVNAKLER